MSFFSFITMPAPYTCFRLSDKYMAAKNILAMPARRAGNARRIGGAESPTK